jgi:RNA polymerase primary sigma factor
MSGVEMTMTTGLSAEQERDLGRRILAAEERAKGELGGIQGFPQRKRKGSERTRAGDVDRLTLTARKILEEASDQPEVRARAAAALGHLKQAEDLRWQLAMSGVRIAHGEARKLRSAYMDGADLTQEGFIGLLRAASRFDPDRDIRFGTYARWWVRAQMTRAIDSNGRVVRLPGCAVEQLRNLRKVMVEVSSTGEDLSLAEMADRAGIDAERADMLLTHGKTVSFDEPVDQDPDSRSWAAFLADEDSVDPFAQAQLGEEVARMLDALNDVLDERKRYVLVQRFGLQDGVFQSLTEIARRMGLSRERVRQLERDALLALRNAMRDLNDERSRADDYIDG